jgi:hypothetical protein
MQVEERLQQEAAKLECERQETEKQAQRKLNKMAGKRKKPKIVVYDDDDTSSSSASESPREPRRIVSQAEFSAAVAANNARIRNIEKRGEVQRLAERQASDNLNHKRPSNR